VSEGFYFQTPNVMVPLNSRGEDEIAPIAMEQLRSYQRRAANWPMERHEHWDERHDMFRNCWCCTVCDPCETLWFVDDPAGQIFTYTEDEILTLKVAHIRQAHDKDGTNNGKRTD
jgi:hypothetical protein